MTTAGRHAQARGGNRLPQVALRTVIGLALVVDAVVHIRLAPGYQQSAPSGIGAGNLFRIEAAAALVVAVWVVWRGSRAALLAAFAVGASACAAVVLYRYVDVPALGPIPAMYEPVWFTEKSLSAVAEAVAAVGAAAGLVLSRRDRTGA